MKIASFNKILLLLFFPLFVNAQCVIEEKDLKESAKFIYVNEFNGSDELAKSYPANSVKNPYKPGRISAYQTLEKALMQKNIDNDDRILLRRGNSWVDSREIDVNSPYKNVHYFNEHQCNTENLVWLDSGDTQQTTEEDRPTTAEENQLVKFKDTTTDTLSNVNKITNKNIQQFDRSSMQSETIVSKTSSATSSNGSGGTNNKKTSNTQRDTSKLNDLDTSYVFETDLSSESNRSLVQYAENSVISDSANPLSDSAISHSGAAICSGKSSWETQIVQYPKDDDGWSVIKPDIETKIVYVSSSEGNDSYARPYSGIEVLDPFNPKNIQAYKTIEEAYAQIRDGKPDWILLKKGDQFELEKTLWLKTGKSQQAHIVFGAYGDKNGKRPVLDSKEGNVMEGLRNRSFITIVGIEFYASRFDPASPRFKGWGGETMAAFRNVASNVNGNKHVKGIHLENNRFNYYSTGIIMSSMEEATNNHIVIRRNEILNSYSEDSHSQGMFLSRLNGAIIEENILDHNGWYKQRPIDVPLNSKTQGYATIYNHNIYISNGNNMIIRRNLSSRSSSIGMKFTSDADSKTKMNKLNSQNILLKDNVVIEGEVGFSLGGNTDFNNGYRWNNVQVIGNVFSNIGRTQPTNRNIAWNIDVNDWQSGSVCGNFILDQTNSTVTNVTAIMLQGQNGEVSIDSNTIFYQEKAEEFNINSKPNTTNYLDAYLQQKSYADYINDVLLDLKNNPNNHYNIDEVLDYFKKESSVAARTNQ